MLQNCVISLVIFHMASNESFLLKHISFLGLDKAFTWLSVWKFKERKHYFASPLFCPMFPLCTVQKCVVTISHHFLAISSSPEWFICVGLDLFANWARTGVLGEVVYCWNQLGQISFDNVEIRLKKSKQSLYVFAAIGAKFDVHIHQIVSYH